MDLEMLREHIRLIDAAVSVENAKIKGYASFVVQLLHVRSMLRSSRPHRVAEGKQRLAELLVSEDTLKKILDQHDAIEASSDQKFKELRDRIFDRQEEYSDCLKRFSDQITKPFVAKSERISQHYDETHRYSFIIPSQSVKKTALMQFANYGKSFQDNLKYGNPLPTLRETVNVMKEILTKPEVKTRWSFFSWESFFGKARDSRTYTRLHKGLEGLQRAYRVTRQSEKDFNYALKELAGADLPHSETGPPAGLRDDDNPGRDYFSLIIRNCCQSK